MQTDKEMKIERNREAMRRFETCINTNDLALGEELISTAAAFTTPVSPTPLYGAKGYLSVVDFMLRSFPDVQWKLMNSNLYPTGTNRFLVPRYYVDRSTSLSAFASMITH